MELEKLLQQRDAYGRKILKLGIKIAFIFLLPIIIGVIIHRTLDIPLLYILLVAFIVSWSGIIVLYRKISKQVRTLDAKIRELKTKEKREQKLL